MVPTSGEIVMIPLVDGGEDQYRAGQSLEVYTYIYNVWRLDQVIVLPVPSLYYHS